MGSGPGEILGWVYVLMKILGLVALAILGGVEAYRYRRRRIHDRDGTDAEGAVSPQPKGESDEAKKE
jgi:hypothetical protein